MTTIYQKGRKKEYKIVEKYVKQGLIAFRSAGSHSPIDVVAIDYKNREIFLVQSKRTLKESMFYIDPKLKKKLEERYAFLNGDYKVRFKAR